MKPEKDNKQFYIQWLAEGSFAWTEALKKVDGRGGECIGREANIAQALTDLNLPSLTKAQLRAVRSLIGLSSSSAHSKGVELGKELERSNIERKKRKAA